jgi:hypothetical protein
MADVLEGLVATLAEHGHQPPYTALVSRTDSALFGALANKVVTLVDTGAQVIRGGLTSGPTYYRRGHADVGAYRQVSKHAGAN